MQLGPWFIGIEELEFAGQIPATVLAGGEGGPAREDQGASVVLAGGDLMVGSTGGGGMAVNRSGGGGA
jgi:hypothetical protein